MYLHEAHRQSIHQLHCQHPAHHVVIGNDRMELVCVLCGAELPFDQMLDRERDGTTGANSSGTNW